MRWTEVVAEALARNDRFLDQVVEGLDVCPYARSARLASRTRRYVLPDLATSTTPLTIGSELQRVFDEIATEPSVEVVQLIFPRAAAGPRDWVRQVKELTARLQAAHGRSVVGVAAFHPGLPYSEQTPAGLVPLFRRSPDPTIQWIRLDVLERVRAGRPDGDVALPSEPEARDALLAAAKRTPLGDQIAAANFARVGTLGIGRVQALIDAVGGTD